MNYVGSRGFLVVCLALFAFYVDAFAPSITSSNVARCSLSTKHGVVLSSSSTQRLNCKLGGFSLPLMRLLASVEGEDGQDQLSLDQISEMVEISFIRSCLQLSQGYVDVLKLFIVAVKAAFEMDVSPLQLVDSVVTCPVNTAGRELMPEEIQLRTTWINAVYLMLEHINHNGKGTLTDIDETVRRTYSGILPHLLAMKQSGGSFQAEEILRKYADDLPSMDDPMEMAIVSQTIRVLWYTLTVLEEEKLAQAPITPRPPIPRGPGMN